MLGGYPARLGNVIGSTQVPVCAWNNAPEVFFHQESW
jgi:hypothetical protein